MHPVLGTMMPEICEAPHFSCQPRLHTQIVGMRSLHSPMTSLKTSIKTITYLSDIGCLEIHGASLVTFESAPAMLLRYVVQSSRASSFLAINLLRL